MACLSVFRKGGGAVVAANPIYVTSPASGANGSLTFEVLQADGSFLAEMMGETQHYAMDSRLAFWAVLESLEPCQSAHPSLAPLRLEPCMRGVLKILEGGVLKDFKVGAPKP